MSKHFQSRIAALLLCLLLLAGCTVLTPDEAQPTVPQEETPVQADVPAPAQPEPPEEPAPEPEPEPEPEPDIVLRITAAGDNLLHNTLSIDSRLAGGGYDFNHLYTPILPYVQGSDIAFINQEVMLTGEEGAYPRLAAPAEAGDAVRAAGFNVVNLATNHSLDKGVDGLESCLENVAAQGFDAVIGAHQTQEEAETPIIIEKQGIRIGFLSYTYGLNGFSLPEGREYMLHLIEEPKMVKDLQAIRPLCDYLIVSMHWGTEYQHEVGKWQRELGTLLCDYGADLIIGTHPHVLEPAEMLTSANGHQTLCVWSLGNFISGQHKSPTMLGGLLQMRVRFSPEHELIGVDDWGVAATVTHYDGSSRGYAVYALEDYTDELAAAHGIRNYDRPMTLDYAHGLAEEVLGDALRAPITWNEQP